MQKIELKNCRHSLLLAFSKTELRGEREHMGGAGISV